MNNSVLAVGQLRPDQVVAVLRAAEQAPTLGSVRPWELLRHSNSFQLRLLDDAGGPTSDNLVMCGMALLNLRLAIQTLGVEVTIALMPEVGSPDSLAAVLVGGSRPISYEQLLLAAQIFRVDAEVAEFLPQQVPAELSAAFRHAARTEQAWAAAITWSQLGEVGWVAEPEEELSQAGREQLVLMVGTLADDAASRLRAGKALQRILLIATGNGLAATSFRLPSGMESARQELRTLIGGGLWPQVLVRIGVPAVDQ